MKNYIFTFLAVFVGAVVFSSCDDEETYAEQKEKERDAISAFLGRNVNIIDETGDTLCKVGVIKTISEQEFLAKDSVTNLDENEYVLFANSGVYMQIVRKGVGDIMQPGEKKRIICRFVEYNILGDSIQLRNDVPYWHTNPDILDVSNTSGTFSGTFNTTINGGGAMYAAYSSTSVPSGWLAPLSYVRIGRQYSEEQIAKVRLIVPHSEGHAYATSSVYPCFYEITYQEMRN